MKHILLVIISCFAITAWGQDGNPERRRALLERVEAMRAAYITEKLDLSKTESEQFWPVYNEYSKKRMELRQSYRQDKRNKQVTEEDAQKQLDDQFDKQEEMIQLKRNYYTKFQASLPAQKLAKLDQAENEFNIEILKKLKERREEKRNR